MPAAIIGSFNKRIYFQDSYNKAFLYCGTLILLSALFQNFLLINKYDGLLNPKNSLIGILNWLPLFWLFWSLQPFLNSKVKREIFVKVSLFGSVPIIITGFGQYFFDWFGPFETLNGLIVWYQRPMLNNEGLTGLFSNQNYAGSWLNFILPFSIALIFEKTENILKKNISILFLISIGIATFLTHSRNAWAGMIIVLPIVIGQESLIWLIPVLSALLIFFIFALSPTFSGPIQEFFRDLIPIKSLTNISQTLQFTDYKIADGSRLSQLLSSISIIKNNLWFGVGATSFSVIYLLENQIFRGHSHNIITELAISYGLPGTLILIVTITSIIIISGNYIFFKKDFTKNINYYERAIWASIFFFIISQMFDIQYFDGRISIFAWTLIACLKNIIDENKLIYKNPFTRDLPINLIEK